MSFPRIFVQIPSYRDRECQWTIQDLFEKASHPERVFVGVCWQTVEAEDADCFTVQPKPEQVRAQYFPASEAKGLGWARQQAQNLWQGEEYTLQIDSHMRFIPGWDEAMLQALAECDSPDPVLTVYPPGYVPPGRLIERPQPAVQYVKRFLPSGLLDFSCAIVPTNTAGGRPVPTAACAGGFIFGSSRILRDVPSDPEIYFNGEEPNLAVRLWTAGFDLFSPQRTLLYHYYLRKESIRHWNDSQTWNDRQKRTMRRIRALCQPDECPPDEVQALGRYGLGTQRTLAEYEAFSGVNFAGRTIARYARSYPFVQATATRRNPQLPSEELKPTQDASLFLVGEEALLFREVAGEFYRLNSSSAFVWCAREEGYSWQQIAQEQAETRNIPVETCTAELADLAAHWLGQGLLQIPGESIPALPGTPRVGPRFDPSHFDFRTRTFELLGQAMAVRYGDRELEERIHPVIGHLEIEPNERGVIHTFTVARILDYVYLFRDQEMLHHGDNAAALAPPLKFQLMERAILRLDPIVQIHAGAVECDGCLVMMPGQSGDGKTMLTARLVALGGIYFSDEVVLFERGTRRVKPAPISFCVKTKGRPLLEKYFPGLGDLIEHQREDGLTVRYQQPPAGSLPPSGHTAEPRLIVFRRYAEGAKQSLRSLPPVEAFGRLMDHCVSIPKRLSVHDATALVGFLQNVECFELTGSDLDEDAKAVWDLCRQQPRPVEN